MRDVTEQLVGREGYGVMVEGRSRHHKKKQPFHELSRIASFRLLRTSTWTLNIPRPSLGSAINLLQILMLHVNHELRMFCEPSLA